MPILERLPNIYNTCNMYNTLTQYCQWSYYLHNSIAQQYCTAVLHTFVCNMIELYCSQYWYHWIYCTYCIYWAIVPIIAHYCTLLFTTKLTNTAAADFFAPGQLPLAIAALFTRLLTAYCPCCSTLISHSNQESHGFTVHRRPPLRARPRPKDHLPPCRIQIPEEACHPLEGPLMFDSAP